MATEGKQYDETCGIILNILEKLYHVTDVNILLDTILLEARRLTHADAGSIYLVDNNVLHFSYIHNDSLFDSGSSNKYIYTSHVIEISNRSLSGYVALTGEPLVIDDVYLIPADQPFTFNRALDDQSGYRTKSLLSVPLTTSRQKIVGVLQLINALSDTKEILPFTEHDKTILNYFAINAAAAIERAMINRDVILRMIKLCELRDPKETGPHANRVGAYSAEIYHQWSLKKGIDQEEIKKTKDLIRVAAMLHDLGKVAISDVILKKPAGLDRHEFQIMKHHTVYGARLFENTNSELDAVSAEIALNHHEKWDGSGYPGKIHDLFSDDVQMGPGKQGEEIPITGRIVALADVYDALVSRRVYKEPFSEERSMDIIQEQSGKHFDPDVVDAFFSIYDVIIAIRGKYQEEEVHPSGCRIAP